MKWTSNMVIVLRGRKITGFCAQPFEHHLQLYIDWLPLIHPLLLLKIYFSI